MIDEIKNKTDIVDFINQYVPLKGAGGYYRGLCPFHNEKNPSFYVSPEKQIFKCFGCNEWGSVIDFYMKIENVDFKEAIKALAEKAGIEIQQYSSASSRERNIILEINRVALRFFRNKLKENKEAFEYLLSRGLKEDTIDFFELGYAPLQNELRDYLFSLGYSLKNIQSAGLLTYGKEDRFRQRIIFPFIDHAGKVVGFTGRIYPEIVPSATREDVAKYLNTSETELFKKSQFLYGLYHAIPHAKEEKSIIVVEGQMDFLACWQNNIKNVVAISGTAFTEEQLKILRRYTRKIAFALDEDEAGFRATLKSIPLAIKTGFQIEKIIFPNAKDLGEFLSSGISSGDSLSAVPLIDYFFEYGLKNYDLSSSEGKKKFLELLLPYVKFLDLVDKSNWLSRISNSTDIDEKLLYKELDKIQPIILNINQEKNTNDKFLTDFGLDDRYLNLVERILAVILALEKLYLVDELSEYFFQKKELIEKIKNNIYDEEGEIIRLRALYEQEKNSDLEYELNFLTKEIKKEFLKKKIQELKQALNFKNDEESDKILEKVKSYTVLLKQL